MQRQSFLGDTHFLLWWISPRGAREQWREGRLVLDGFSLSLKNDLEHPLYFSSLLISDDEMEDRLLLRCYPQPMLLTCEKGMRERVWVWISLSLTLCRLSISPCLSPPSLPLFSSQFAASSLPFSRKPVQVLIALMNHIHFFSSLFTTH